MSAIRPSDQALLTAVGTKVRLLRIARGLSQHRLAAGAQLSRVTLGGIEAGQHAANLLTYVRLAAALGVTLAELFDDRADLITLTSHTRDD